MSFACSDYGFLHLLISVTYFVSGANSLTSLRMKDLLFVERRTHSSYELVKEFFNRTLLPLCDLTANICDINCCLDPDCSEENMEVFDCPNTHDTLREDVKFFDPYYCYNNNSSDFTTVDPILCYEIENSPYLGTYYLEERILKRNNIELYLEKAANSKMQKHFVHAGQPHQNKQGPYKYGSPLKLTESKLSLTLPNEILGKGYCSYDHPIKYLMDTSSVCSTKLDAQLCGQNSKLNLKSYFEEDDKGQLYLSEIYSGNDSSSIQANVRVLCSPDVEIERFFPLGDIFIECDDSMAVKEAKLDSSNKICMNVVKNIDYHFIWHGNSILVVDVTVVLSNIPLREPVSSLIPSRKNTSIVVPQAFNVHFVKKINFDSRSDHGSYFQNDRITLQNLT